MTPEDVISWIRDKPGYGEQDVHNGTEDTVLDAWADTVPLSHHATSPDQWAAELTRGAVIRVCIHDNGFADPAPPPQPFEHWIAVIDAAPGGWRCHNPWGGRNIVYSFTQLRAAYIESTSFWLDGVRPDLGAYPFYDQLKVPDQDSREMCGETVMAAIASCLLFSRASAANGDDDLVEIDQ